MLTSPLLQLWSPLLCLLVAPSLSVATGQLNEVTELALKGLGNVSKELWDNLISGKQCNPLTMGVRREWGTLSRSERKSYIAAVKCLMEKPSIADPSFAPGAKTRYDDFVAVHINQTTSIHGTGSFLSWHRYFVWSYEQALKNECGYRGSQPYWDWGLWAEDPEKSPIFDGSDTSMSGNGEYVVHEGHAVAGGKIFAPPGNGGGCIKSGPFKGMTVNLGPMNPNMNLTLPKNPQANGLGYNPRCLRRDISPWFTRQWTRPEHIADLILNYTTLATFQARMQGDFPNKFAGVHSAAHFTIWGDPGGDLFASPGDPAFWLLHGMIDRVWWIWQTQNLASRLMTIAGTITVNNNPPSRNQTLDDLIVMGVNGVARPIKDLVSTTAGPFCYIYL